MMTPHKAAHDPHWRFSGLGELLQLPSQPEGPQTSSLVERSCCPECAQQAFSTPTRQRFGAKKVDQTATSVNPSLIPGDSRHGLPTVKPSPYHATASGRRRRSAPVRYSSASLPLAT
jgi:hypothetical protein